MGNFFYSISLVRLKTETRQMVEGCFWKNSHYWGSHPIRRGKRHKSPVVIRVAYFKSLDWFGFNFSQYHQEAVEVMQKLPSHQRFFHEQVQDRYTKFKIWCIDGKHFKSVIAQLQLLSDVELEFVVNYSHQGLIVPTPFKELEITFYELGRC